MLEKNVWQFRGFWTTVIVFIAVVVLIGFSKPNPSHNLVRAQQLYTSQQLYLESQ